MNSGTLNNAPPGDGAAPRTQPALLVLDTSYTFETIVKLNQLDSVVSRDLEGYFRHVWSVHPLASLKTSELWAPRFGRPQYHVVNHRHTFVEGKIGRFAALRFLFPLNFLIAQLGLLISLLALIKTERIAAIRVGDPLYLGIFGTLLSKLARVPIVIRVNGNNEKVRQVSGRPLMPQLLRSKRLERAIERFVFPRASWVFAPNQDNLDFALSCGANSERSSVISYGSLLDQRHFVEPAKRNDASADLRELEVESGQFLMTIGRLIQPKFPDHLLHALHAARSAGFDVKAVFVGSGELLPELQNLAVRLGISAHVIFAGDRNQDWLWRVLPHAAAVLSPSTGRALCESALAAVPVAAYDTDWQSELIETGKTGWLVAYRDCSALSSATLTILREPASAKRIGQNLRTRALEKLDPMRACAEERNVYRKLLSSLA